MARKRKKIIKKKVVTKRTILIDFLIILLFLAIAYYTHNNFSNSVKKSFSFGLIIVFAGMLFEYKQITNNWEKVIIASIGTLLFSLVAFLPGRNEGVYDIYSHLSFFTYTYIFVFAIFALNYYRKKTISKLTEGITLIQSIAIIYWILDFGSILAHNWFVLFLIFLGITYAIFSIYNAFSYRKLTEKTRLSLSIWSAIIMVIFGFEFIFKVLVDKQLNKAQGVFEISTFSLQHFLLGISIIYIVQNFLLLFDFFPAEGKLMAYESKKELKKEHLKRYSDNQVKISHSILIFVITTLFFVANYYFKMLPRNVAIWMVFIFFPYIITLFEFLKKKKD